MLTKLNLILVFLNYSKGANILAIFPTPSISHQVVYQTLARDLISRGHYLTILTPSPVKINNPNVTEIDLSETYELFHNLFNFAEFKDFRNDEIGFIRKASVIFEQLMNVQLSHPQVKELINGKGKFHFDLMIIEHTGYFPMLAFAEIYDCPVIGITSFEAPGFTYQMFGNEANIIIHPEQNLPFISSELTFIQRWKIIKSSFMMIAALLIPPSPLQKLNDVLSNHFPDVTKTIYELLDRVELLMVNVHPAMGFVRPLVPNTIQLGFMHIEPPKLLEEAS
ncbi:hypothetical protein PVAND_007926 [Polypedilum vanderplanki]|uniref:UDP-glucuronosyltransferase n=1 Tax=Polypedilum vanderplanki TaxID=319348 RepID=A0A9J6C868_POLVA|nr:hypothetical protein PVAND_007926 [Polypedilum vanderplanki]